MSLDFYRSKLLKLRNEYFYLLANKTKGNFKDKMFSLEPLLLSLLYINFIPNTDK